MLTKFLLLFLFLFLNLQALLYKNSQANWLVDIHPSFKINEQKAPKVLQWVSAKKGITFQVITYQKSRFSSLKQFVDFTKKQLKLKGIGEEINYFSYQSYFIDGQLVIDNELVKAQLFCFFKKNSHPVLMISLCNDKDFTNNKLLIASLFDSFSIDEETYLKPGPFSYLAFPVSRRKQVIDKKKVSFELHTFEVFFNFQDIALMEAVVKRETEIISTYSDVNYDALKRFYRMIFRSSYESVGFLVEELKSLYPKENTFTLFNYIYLVIRNMKTEVLNGKEIIKTPLNCILEQKGDCDTKSLLLHILLRHLKVDSEILISLNYHHAAIGLPQFFSKTKKDVFLIGESNHKLVYYETLLDPIITNPYQTDVRAWFSFQLYKMP